MTPAIRRAFAALFAFWFTVLTVEPAALHSCPMHGGMGVVASGASAHGDHSGHGVDRPADSPPESHVCNCLGDCAGAAAPATPVTLSAGVHFVATSTGLRALTRPIVAIDFAIPFANGPPRAPGAPSHSDNPK